MSNPLLESEVRDFYGLNKAARLMAKRELLRSQQAPPPELDPDFPYSITPFPEGFFSDSLTSPEE